MTEIELGFYHRLDDEIYVRAEDICEHLDLLYKASVEVFVDEDRVYMSIVDYEGDTIDSLSMSYKQFCSYDYLLEAEKILAERKRQQEIAKKKAAELKEKEDLEKRKALYEKLKEEFE